MSTHVMDKTADLAGPGVGDYVLATTGGQREPGGDSSWRALILGPLR